MGSRRIGTGLRLALIHSTAVAIAVVMVSVGGVRAYAAASPTPGRSIAVSVPPDPVSLKAGHVGTVQLRVVNPGLAPVRVRIEGRALTLGNEGKVTVKDSPDPLWNNRVRFPPGPFTIPAQGFKNLTVKVHTPKSLQPDLYFLGFLVTPLPNAATGVTVINQIGGFFTIDIPGPRDRRLTADLELPGWSILGFHLYLGSNLTGILHVHNVGHAAVRFWGETDVSATGGSPSQVRIPISLMPSLRERTFAVSGKPAWPIGFVHTQVRIVYPTSTETTTTEILFTRSDLVINPLVFVVVALLVLVVIMLAERKRRRRRAALPGLATPPRSRLAFLFGPR
jgi:hypothetical protein